MSSPPTRLPDDLYQAAKHTGATASRSTAQQIAHWARIGRELESSANVSHKEVERVLAGDANYTSLNEHEQALVRAEWDTRIAAGIDALDLEAEFTAAGDTWVVGDKNGNAVTRKGKVAVFGAAKAGE